MSWLSGISKIFKVGGKTGKVATEAGKVTKAGSGALKLGALGGISTFFGFEWLTSGGLVDSVGGALGISNTASSILVVGVVVVVLGITLYALYSRLTRSRPKPRSRGR